MKIGNVSNVKFRGPLEREDFIYNPSLNNFRRLSDNEKLDMIYDTLLKQNEKIKQLSKNQQNMNKLNVDGFRYVLTQNDGDIAAYASGMEAISKRANSINVIA